MQIYRPRAYCGGGYLPTLERLFDTAKQLGHEHHGRSVADRLGRTHRCYAVVVHLNDKAAAPAEKPAHKRIAALDDNRVRVLVDLDAEPLGNPRLEELVEGAPPAAAGIGLTSHYTTVSRSRVYEAL